MFGSHGIAEDCPTEGHASRMVAVAMSPSASIDLIGHPPVVLLAAEEYTLSTPTGSESAGAGRCPARRRSGLHLRVAERHNPRVSDTPPAGVRPGRRSPPGRRRESHLAGRWYDRAVTESAYRDSAAALLLLPAVCHLFFASRTTYWMTKPGVVRFVGGCLLLLALPCLWWRGWYFWTLFDALVISGAWRLCFPHHSIRAQ
jgi:hypothetical protein